MEIQLSTALAIGSTIFIGGGAWAVVRNSTIRLEKAIELLEGRVNEKLTEYKEKKDDQARRIGRVEQRVSGLEGRLQSDDGTQARRIRTAAGGIPITSDADEDR